MLAICLAAGESGRPSAGDPRQDMLVDLVRGLTFGCHPALGLQAQVALTLRALGGLRTDEIARAFLVPADHETPGSRRSRCEIQNSLAMLEVCWD